MKRERHLHGDLFVVNDLTKDTTRIRTELISNKYNYIQSLFYTSFVKKGITIKDIHDGLEGVTGIKGRWDSEIIKMFIDGDDNDIKYINIIETDVKIKGNRDIYYDLTEDAKYLFNQYCNSDDRYEYIIEAIEKLNVLESHRYLTGYEVAIAQHSSISHYAAIKNLADKLEESDVKYKSEHRDTQIKIPYTRNKVEFDLLFDYNRKTYGVEVECGTTSLSDMNRKLYKHNLLYKNSSKFKKIIIACPNAQSLEHTKYIIENVIKNYKSNYEDSFYIEYVYLNLSTVNKKNTIRKHLNTLLRGKASI